MLSLSDIVNVKVGIGKGVFEAPGATVIGGKKPSSNLEILKLFTNGEQGFAYDPNDLTTLYQDAAGTIPVTAAGQPVGLMLDKSKGLSIGTERLQRPVFEADAWAGIDASISFVDGKMIRDGSKASGTSPAYNRNKSGNALTVGKSYRLEITIESVSGLPPYISTGGVGGNIYFNKVGSNVSIVTMAVQSGFFFIVFPIGTNCVISNISIKELAGNHAYQTVSASRPILQQTPILAANLLPTYDFRTWDTVGTPNPVTANSFTTASSGGVRATILKPNAKYVLELDIENTSNINIYHGANAQTTFLAGTRRKVLFEATIDAGGVLYLRNTAAGTTTVYSIKVQEITGYRTDQNYLAFDGVDDFLQTNNIDFTATDKLSLITGVRKLSDATLGTIASFQSTSGDIAGAFSIRAPSGNGLPTYGGSLDGLSVRDFAATGYTAPSSAIISAMFSVSSASVTDALKIRIMAQSQVLTGSGVWTSRPNFGNHPLYIGRRGGGTQPFNGHLYGLIAIGRLTTDSETNALEKSIAKNTGVTLNA